MNKKEKYNVEDLEQDIIVLLKKAGYKVVNASFISIKLDVEKAAEITITDHFVV